MLPRHLVERYLRFLLRHRLAMSLAIFLGTAAFLVYTVRHVRIFTNFFDLYPGRVAITLPFELPLVGREVVLREQHPYIRLYKEYRHLFGTANVLVLILEVKNGTIFDDVETIHKIDRITLELLHNIPGVNGEQVLSLTHPKLKTTLTSGTGIKVAPIMYPRVPETKEDLEFLRQKVYTTEGVRGFFVSPDDKATLITAGFWEEQFDLFGMWKRIQEIIAREEDDNHKIYVAGPPILFAYFFEAVARPASVFQPWADQWLEGIESPGLRAAAQGCLSPMALVFYATGLTMLVLLWFYFRTVQGVVIPAFSGLMSAVWGLGFAGLCGFNLDPLVLVVPLLITARALSHSVQSMERYHEEYYRLGDKEQAILCSYVALYSPAMVSILSDGLAILTIAVASIPLMQKLALVSSFWIISIFLSVVTLHPIILSYVRPPRQVVHAHGLADRLYGGVSGGLIRLSRGGWRWGVAGLFVVVMIGGVYYARKLKVGDTSIGMALLDADHPYNVAFHEVNEKFVGANQLVIIAEGKKRGAIKDAKTLTDLDLFARFMQKGAGAGGAITATTLLKKIFRTFHEGDPKWEILPDRNDYVSQLFFFLTANTSRGEMDRFFDMQYRNATITVFYRDYNHEIVMDAIKRAKAYIAAHGLETENVRYRLAGGLLGLLAAVNEEVDWSYRVNITLILLVVFVLSVMTYWSVSSGLLILALAVGGWLLAAYWTPLSPLLLVPLALYLLWNVRSVAGTLIVMIPSIVAQPLSEAVMYLMGIDFNIDSLPVAAVGIGIGIDYGYYVLSRIVEEYEKVGNFDEANRRAIQTTGKAILFTGTTLIASVVFWLFFPLKFQAEMALLLMMLLVFQLGGALIFVPAMVSLLRPRFAVERAPATVELARARASAG